MKRDKRLYPIDEELFNRLVLLVIESSYITKKCTRSVGLLSGYSES